MTISTLGKGATLAWRYIKTFPRHFRFGLARRRKLVQPFQDSMSVGEEALMPLCMHSMSQNPRIRVEVYEYAEVVYSSI